MMRRLYGVAVLGLLALCFLASPARADLHTWKINELFSDSTGTYQFIEMHESAGTNNQDKLATSFSFPNHTLDSNANTFTFLTNLPSTATANKFFLAATAGFSSLSGAVTPDYVIPDDFFSISGDTISFSSVDSFAFTAGQLPTDGTHSLLRGDGSVVNSPRNFAGATGSVSIVNIPEPSTLCLILIGSFGLLARAWCRKKV